LELVERLLFKQIEKPKNLLMTKIINVFDNRYRINLYVTVEENGLTKRKIKASYFARLVGDALEIVA
jgi:hypothetical protein